MENLIKEKKLSSIFESFNKSLLILLLFVALVFGSVTLLDVELGGYDEIAYSNYVNVMNNHGVAGIRNLIKEYPTDEFLNKAPSPLRLLFVFSGLITSKIFNNYRIENLALISFLSSIILVVVAFCLLRNWFTPTVAFLAASLLMISPLGLALSRRALQDSFLTLIVISSIFFYHKCWMRKTFIDPLMLGLLILAGLFTKESMILLYPSYIAAGIYYRKKLGSFPALRIMTPLLLAPFIYLITISWIAGGMQIFIKHYLFYTQMSNKIEYAVRFQKGPWFRYLIDFMLISPLTFLFAVIGMTAPISSKKNLFGRNLVNLYFFSGLAMFSFLPILNIRIVFFLDIFLRAMAIIGAISILENKQYGRYKYFIAALLFCCIVGIDLFQFFQLFIKSGIYDPITDNLIYANGFIR